MSLCDDVVLDSLVELSGFWYSLLVQGLEAHLALYEGVEHGGKLIEYWLQVFCGLLDSLYVFFDFCAFVLEAVLQVCVRLCKLSDLISYACLEAVEIFGPLGRRRETMRFARDDIR